MKALKKPYAEDSRYHCFGCSPNNPIGINMEFTDLGNEIESRWKPHKNYEGFQNILHGGIQSTMIDEIAAWCINIQEGTSGVTAKMNIQYLKPVLIDKGEIRLTAFVRERNRRFSTVEVKLFNSENELCTKGDVQYFLFPEEVAKEKYKYPGKEAFY